MHINKVHILLKYALELCVYLRYNALISLRRERVIVPIRYKIDIMEALQAAGYSTYRLRQERLLGERVIQQLRSGEIVSWKSIDTICALLDCQPGDLVERVPKGEEAKNKVMTFRTMQRKANEAGYSLQRGRQHYLHEGWGLVRDNDGNPIIGYQIYDYGLNAIIRGISSANLWDHDLTYEEAVEAIKELCEAEGVKFDT